MFSRKSPLLTRVLWGLGFMVAIWAAGAAWLHAAGDGGLPSCTDAAPELHRVFAEAPASRQHSLTIVESSDHREVFADDASGVRNCEAALLLNSGRQAIVQYGLRARESGGYLITFEAR